MPVPERSSWMRWETHGGWYAACLVVLGALLKFQCSMGVVPLAGVHDSELYLRLARSILQGNWLGPYDVLTLIRMPVYPQFLAQAMRWGMGLQQAQAFLHPIAALLMIAALRSVGVSAVRVFGFVLLYGLHPAVWMPIRFVATESLALSLVTATIACGIGILASKRKESRARWGWAVLFGFFFALAFWVREEGVWLLPFGLALGWTLWVGPSDSAVGWEGLKQVGVRAATGRGVDRGSHFWGRMRPDVWGIGLLCVVCVVVVRCAIVWKNKAQYGVSVTTELSEPGFKAAFGAMTRLDAERHHPYVPITRKAMKEAADVSPRFGEMYPFLEKQLDGKGWSQYGCAWMGVCGEIAGGWMVWAFRDAASKAGKHADARAAAAFYAEMAEELRSACAAGSVRCTRNPSGNVLAPPLQARDIGRIFFSCGRVLWMTIWMPGLGEGIAAVDAMPKAQDTEQIYAAAFGPEALAATGGLLFRLGPYLVWVYRGLHLIGCGLIAAWLFRSVLRWRDTSGLGACGISVRQAACILLAVVIASRTLLVAYIDAMSFWAQLRYMIYVYPAGIALVMCREKRAD